jgi:hypothetical protein
MLVSELKRASNTEYWLKCGTAIAVPLSLYRQRDHVGGGIPHRAVKGLASCYCHAHRFQPLLKSPAVP